MKQAAARTTTKSHNSSSSDKRASKNAPDPKQTFVATALDMSWKLAIVVLVPVIAGVQLDKKFDTTVYTFIGLGLAFIGSGVVMWRAMQRANRIPTPKLTEEEKRAIRKSYEDEDKE